MSLPGSVDSPARLPRPELNRRPRRRRGGVLILFAVAAFVLAGACIAGLGPAGELPEGMLWMALASMAVMLVLAGCGLVLGGILLRLRPVSFGPAWLVDPVDPALARWWDGQEWTEHTSARSAQTRELAPLASSSTRRRWIGAGLLAGGSLVAAVSEWLAGATVVTPTDVNARTNDLSLLLGQLVVPALGAAVVGVYLLLTLADDVRPGWQPDPLHGGQHRWWDGVHWSDSTTRDETLPDAPVAG